jgi:hypothetical protein
VSDGKGCRCNAHCEHECCCDADWTPKEVYDLRAEVAALKAERDEAHSLIRKWKVNLVEVVDDGEIMYAMTNDSMCNMTDSDKRAFLAATAKERGGA